MLMKMIVALTVEWEVSISVFQVITDGELAEGSQTDGDVQKFSINIQEDGTVNASDIEALRNLYSDQQIVIVLENQQQ